jgi:hypothetical protein
VLGIQLVVAPAFERFSDGEQIALTVASEHLHLMRNAR